MFDTTPTQPEKKAEKENRELGSKPDVQIKMEEFLKKKKRLPSSKELEDLAGVKHQQARALISDFKKTLTHLIVLPDGKVFSEEGKPVWVRLTTGSMSLARYKEDAQLGKMITP